MIETGTEIEIETVVGAAAAGCLGNAIRGIETGIGTGTGIRGMREGGDSLQMAMDMETRAGGRGMGGSWAN